MNHVPPCNFFDGSRSARRAVWIAVAMRAAVLYLLFAAFPGIVGCSHRGQAQERLDRRRGNFAHTLDMVAEREREAPRRLERTVNLIDEQIERDRRRFAEDGPELRRWLERDVQRFRQRSRGPYQRGLRHFFGGDPENIAPTAIWMFY